MRNWFDGSLDRYQANIEAHDPGCEQRERYGLCHCAKRERLTRGLTEPPTLTFMHPSCDGCDQEVRHDGDSWVCDRCHVWWGINSSGEPGEFIDEMGDLESDERYGNRLWDLAKEAQG